MRCTIAMPCRSPPVSLIWTARSSRPSPSKSPNSWIVFSSDDMTQSHCSRREFLGLSAAAAGASFAAKPMVSLPRNLMLAPEAVPPSERVRFGMIGVGMQGNWLLSESIKVPGVECAAACDLYDGRHTLAREIVRADLPVTRRYQALLDDKSIDCIVAAVPDHWHKQGD